MPCEVPDSDSLEEGILGVPQASSQGVDLTGGATDAGGVAGCGVGARGAQGVGATAGAERTSAPRASPSAPCEVPDLDSLDEGVIGACPGPAPRG